MMAVESAAESAAGLREEPLAPVRPGARHQQYESGLRQLAALRGAAQPQDVNEAGRAQALQALRAMQQRRDGLARHLSLAVRAGDAAASAALRRQLEALTEAEREALRRIGGGALRGFAAQAQRSADDLHAGRRSIDDLSPREFSEMVTWHAGRPASDLLDAPGAPAPVGLALRRFHEGLARLRQDGGRELLEAFNDLFGHELEGLLGRYGYDGSTVVAARFAAPLPHPGSRHHVTLLLQLVLRDAQGRRGEQQVPLLDDHGQMLAHPEHSAAALVRNFHLRDLFDQIGALESIYRAVNADPRSRERIVAGFMQGHEARAARMLDWRHLLGRDPQQWLPRHAGALDVPSAPDLPDAPGAPDGALQAGTASAAEPPHGGMGRRAAPQAAPAAADPYLKGLLYLGHDGRKARYRGNGQWGAP